VPSKGVQRERLDVHGVAIWFWARRRRCRFTSAIRSPAHKLYRYSELRYQRPDHAVRRRPSSATAGSWS
jgi:hypothetical protein